jgi:hypothetical protein
MAMATRAESTLMPFHDRALAILGDTRTNAMTLSELALCLDQLVPFVGAGLSVEFGYPTWSQFLRTAADRFGVLLEVEPLLESLQFEEAAEVITRDRPNAFADFLRQTYDESRLSRPLRKGAAHQLTRIARGPVLTTNFDHVVEVAFEDAGYRFGHTLSGSLIWPASRAVQLKQRSLIKLHRDYLDPQSRVLTLSEYAREYGSPQPGRISLDRPLPSVLCQVLGARPLLFLGCSLKCDRTTLIMAQIAKRLPGIMHFALLPESDNEVNRLRQLDEWSILPLFFHEGRFEKVEQMLACIADALSVGPSSNGESRPTHEVPSSLVTATGEHGQQNEPEKLKSPSKQQALRLLGGVRVILFGLLLAGVLTLITGFAFREWREEARLTSDEYVVVFGGFLVFVIILSWVQRRRRALGRRRP